MLFLNPLLLKLDVQSHLFEGVLRVNSTHVRRKTKTKPPKTTIKMKSFFLLICNAERTLLFSSASTLEGKKEVFDISVIRCEQATPFTEVFVHVSEKHSPIGSTLCGEMWFCLLYHSGFVSFLLPMPTCMNGFLMTVDVMLHCTVDFFLSI